MTNGSKAVTKAFLERGNLQRLVSPTLDVEGPRCFKPGKGAYTYVAQQLGIEPSKVFPLLRSSFSPVSFLIFTLLLVIYSLRLKITV